MATNPIIVIIPGGFCSPEAYAGLKATLERADYETIVVRLRTCTNNPGSDPSSEEWKSLAKLTPFDDAKVVHEAIKSHVEQGREVIFVGHSYGSLPMLASCEGWTTHDRQAKGLPGGIRGVVYLAGFTHSQRGKGVMGNTDYLPIMPYHNLEEGVLTLQPKAIPLFFSDLPAEERESAASKFTLKYMTRSAFGFYPEYIDTDIPVSKTWILPEADAVVDPQYQQMFIQGGGISNIIKIDGGHFAFVSNPEQTSAAVIRAAMEKN